MRPGSQFNLERSRSEVRDITRSLEGFGENVHVIETSRRHQRGKAPIVAFVMCCPMIQSGLFRD